MVTRLKPIIHVAADHAGYQLKESVKQWLQDEGFSVVDHGAHEFDTEDDFPDFISSAASAVSADPKDARAIVVGGSGQGEAMMANRFKRVRATVYYGGDDRIIQLSRDHNDANVLSIGARFIDEPTAKKVIWEWLHTAGPTEDKRYRRNAKLDAMS